MKILLAEDYFTVRRTIKSICESLIGTIELDEVESCADLMKELARKPYTHLILDLILEDGSALVVLPTIRKLYPKLSILVHSVQPASVYGESLKKKYKINYYISKAVKETETIRVLLNFLQNRQPFRDISVAHNSDNPFDQLSLTEKKILPFLLSGLGPKAISKEMKNKPNSVSTLKKRILEKTKTKNLIELKALSVIHQIQDSGIDNREF